MSAGGPFGGQLVGKRDPTSQATPGYDAIAGGNPPLADQGLSNVNIPLKRAPLMHPHDVHRTRQGAPIFLYKPGVRMTGEDGTTTVYGLPDINYGLHMRAIFEEMSVIEKKRLAQIPQEIARYRMWPLTTDELLAGDAIVPSGVLNTEPNDVRFEFQQGQVPAQVEGLHHGIPWLWGELQRGTTVGWHFVRVKMTGTSITDPKGGALNRIAKIPTLQCLPMARHAGVDCHGTGDGSNVDTELDAPEEISVASYEREPDEYGLPLGGKRDATKRVLVFKTRGNGLFFPFGTSDLMMKSAPSKEAIDAAIRTYSGMQTLVNKKQRLSIWLEPNPRIPRL